MIGGKFMTVTVQLSIIELQIISELLNINMAKLGRRKYYSFPLNGIVILQYCYSAERCGNIVLVAPST